MGTYGYAPMDGDGPHDLEGGLNAEVVAPYLVQLFKKKLRKGSRKIVHPEVLKAELEKAGLKRPAVKIRKRVPGKAFARYFKEASKIRTKILRRKDPSLYWEIQDASHDQWNRLGLVQILSEKHFSIPVSVVKKCRTYLRELAKDEGFANSWSEPKLFKKSVANMLKNIEVVLERDKVRQAKAKKQRSKNKHRRGPRQRGPRLIYDAFFRDRPGERKLKGEPKLLPIPRRTMPSFIQKKTAKKKAKKRA